jgi:uncharacterized iron-regulated membrane protein
MSLTDTASDRQLRRTFWRYTILTHRYVGIAISLIILLWCLSGIIMMYVQYPAFDRAERLAGLSDIALDDIEGWKVEQAVADIAAQGFAVETTSRRTVLRLTTRGLGQQVVGLDSGKLVTSWPVEVQQKLGHAYASNRGWAEAGSAVTIERDQWTVQSRFSPHRPMLRLGNADGIEWYVSSHTGEVVQTTTRRERAWNWLGSVIHWLYPTALRQHVAVWAQTVIWLTIFSLFLAITGIAIGIKQFRRRRNGKRTPYSGWALWHHYAGLIFGALTLAWLFSGLFSMNPWGALESRSAGTERDILNGVSMTVGDTFKELQSSASYIPSSTVLIESVFWLGEPYFVAHDRHGNRTRISSKGVNNQVSRSEIDLAASRLSDQPASVELISTGDDYYYSHHQQREFPVYRISYANGERFYISATTGELLRFLDSSARTYRWLFNALHAGDFHGIARARPIWDVFMLLLLVGVTAGVASGTWLGFKRVIRQSPAQD